MKYISDDEQKIGTRDEVEAYEAEQNQSARFDAEIGEYLDSTKLKDGDGNERPLNSREFSRRQGVIRDWLTWDRAQRPERYEEREPEIDTVAIAMGGKSATSR